MLPSPCPSPSATPALSSISTKVKYLGIVFTVCHLAQNRSFYSKPLTTIFFSLQTKAMSEDFQQQKSYSAPSLVIEVQHPNSARAAELLQGQSPSSPDGVQMCSFLSPPQALNHHRFGSEAHPDVPSDDKRQQNYKPSKLPWIIWSVQIEIIGWIERENCC